MPPPTLEERRVFYRSFDARNAFSWARTISATPVFAINPGWYTRIATDRMLSLVRQGYRMVYLRNVRNPKALRAKLLKYLPEGVYYWRNVVSDPEYCYGCPLKFFRRRNLCERCPNYLGQELMFDVDPERVTGKRRDEVGPEEFPAVKDAVIRLYDALAEEFSRLRIVFSGRGFHIHVRDEDTFLYTIEERVELARRYASYGVDVPVTAGGVSLARLPYTLNGISGLVVLPVSRKKLEEFDPYHSSSS
ncbi:MAG: hypothetical protein PWP76_168 [Candidatus Diapherotrites archaeon]|nr:hypothetical protein [Candidatus Diapherotrites archaeon]MDN5366598.1 hypothetical protein [Candidatus Diapherotrites archaeon]